MPDDTLNIAPRPVPVLAVAVVAAADEPTARRAVIAGRTRSVQQAMDLEIKAN